MALLIFVPTSILAGALFFFSWSAALTAILSSILLFMVLVVGIKSLLRQQLFAPLRTIDSVVSRWRHEQFDARVNLESHGELGTLATRLNEMAEHVESVFTKLTIRTRTDLVTGVPGRAQLLLDVTLTTYPVLILMNIDSFKEINDSYGNRAGDEILKELAGFLEALAPVFSFRLYKMPADEFALLFDIPLDAPKITEITEALSASVNSSGFTVDGAPLSVHVTCGVGIGSKAENNRTRGAWPHLIAQADMALKKAKKTFRPYLVYHESLDIQKDFEHSLYWKNAFKQALQEDRIIAHYQPIVDNLTGLVDKYETLVRLEGKDKTIHLPVDFLEVARKSHFDGHITRAMIDQSFFTFANRHHEFSVNLSVRDMLSPEIRRFLLDKVEAQPKTARRLVLEILESEGIENYHEVKNFLSDFQAAGVKVAIDDFGSGYSNFDYLLRLDVDYIKLDASLIRQIDTDKNARVIVKTIVGFSKELGLKTISEHVHTRQVLETTQDLGVDFSQGFYLGRPGTLGEIS